MSVLDDLTKYVKVSVDELKQLISSGLTTLRITHEDVHISGVKRCIHRIYSTNSEYSDVGWVIDEDSNNCMICSKEFWLFLSKHHCRLCGNIICGDCSPNQVSIKELPTNGPQRICKMCDWGQQVS